MTSVFKGVYGRIQALENCEFVTAASKTSPIHIKGKQEYISAVKAGLGEELSGDDQIDEKPVGEHVEEPFQVLKVTFTMNGVPVELQFQLRKDREVARLGGASHLCSKADSELSDGLPGNISGKSDDLRKVNDRKWVLFEGGEDIYRDHTPERRATQDANVKSLERDLLHAFDDVLREAAD